MIDFKILDTRYDREVLGFIPDFLDPDDPRSASAQFNERYAHGGGWNPMSAWKMGPTGEIRYPEDETLFPIAIGILHDGVIRVYPSAWVSITQPDGSFEVSRMD